MILVSLKVWRLITVPPPVEVPVTVSPGCTSGNLGESDRLAVKMPLCPSICKVVDGGICALLHRRDTQHLASKGQWVVPLLLQKELLPLPCWSTIVDNPAEPGEGRLQIAHFLRSNCVHRRYRPPGKCRHYLTLYIDCDPGGGIIYLIQLNACNIIVADIRMSRRECRRDIITNSQT